MKKVVKPEPNDVVEYPISGGCKGKGVILDPKLFGIDKKTARAFKDMKRVLVQAQINDKPSYTFWAHEKSLIIVGKLDSYKYE